MLEFTLGQRNLAMAEVHKGSPEIYADLQSILQQPSLYDEAVRLLARRGFDIDKQCLERDWSQAYEKNDSVAAAWLAVYR